MSLPYSRRRRRREHNLIDNTATVKMRWNTVHHCSCGQRDDGLQEVCAYTLVNAHTERSKKVWLGWAASLRIFQSWPDRLKHIFSPTFYKNWFNGILLKLFCFSSHKPEPNTIINTGYLDENRVDVYLLKKYGWKNHISRKIFEI